MQSWNSYPKIFNVGHKAVEDLFKYPVYIEEKVDGSQFSFGVDDDGVLRTRSKGVEFVHTAAPAMFKQAVDTVTLLWMAGRLQPGFTYRAEAFCKPKHNHLSYGRMPHGGLVLFDVARNVDNYVYQDAVRGIASDIGLEVVPMLYAGMVNSADELKAFMDRDSFLGGTKIEGVVCKQLDAKLFTPDGKPLIAKYVSEAYRETAEKGGNIGGQGWDANILLGELVERFRSRRRWNKAIEHLRDDGKLTDSPRDIALLIPEIISDVEAECRPEIEQTLYDWAWRRIRNGLTKGFPEYYKETLLAKQFLEEVAAA